MPTTATVSDTSADADEAQLDCFRRLTPQQRLQKMVASSRRGRDLALAAIRRSEPEITDQSIWCALLPTSYKIDVFIDRGRQFDQAAFDRAQPESFGPPASEPIPVATVEDSILSKLEWYRLTDETSERRWDDVSRLVRLHATKLDIDYLRTMADSIHVRDLLERVLAIGCRDTD